MLRLESTTTCWQHCQGSHIFANGLVSSCCLHPAIFGDLSKNTLREIYYSPGWTKARRGLFSCKRYPPGGDTDCYQYREFPTSLTTEWKYEDLIYMDIMFGFDCNIRCKMCYQKEHRAVRPKIQLDPELIIRKVDHTPFKEIRVLGGEPLFLPNSLTYIDYLIKIGKRPSVVTNGYYKNQILLEKIVGHFDKYVVSLNAATKQTHEKINVGSKWDQVIENLKTIQRLRGTAKRPVLIAHMTITPDNVEEAPDFLNFVRDFGFDNYEFCHELYATPTFLAGNPDVASRIRDRLIKMNESRPISNPMSLRVLGLLEYPPLDKDLLI